MERIFGYGKDIIEKYGGFDISASYHIIFLLFILAFYVIVPVVMNKQSDKTKKIFRISIALFMLLQNIAWYIWSFLVKDLSAYDIIQRYIPLHLCALTNFLAIITLLTNNKKLFEIVYFWAIGAALMGTVTPDSKYAFPHFEYVQTMIHHSLIIFSSIYLATVEKHEITVNSYAKSSIALQLYLIFMLLFNYLAGTNYMYVNGKPDFYTLTDDLISIFGEWPDYLLGFVLVGWILFSLSYIPFGIKHIINSDNKKIHIRQLSIVVFIFIGCVSITLIALIYPQILSIYIIILVGLFISFIIYSEKLLKGIKQQ